MADCRLFFGLTPFVWHDDLHRSATIWAIHMADTGMLAHSDMRTMLYRHTKNWRKVGENVGGGGSMQAVFDAWVHSPPHFKNLADHEYTHAACAVVPRGDTLWCVQHFATIR